jgi:hypothetical protein
LAVAPALVFGTGMNLQTPREYIDNARHLGKTNHLLLTGGSIWCEIVVPNFSHS